MSNESRQGATPARIFARQEIVGKLYDWILGRIYDLFMDVFAPGYRRTVSRFYERYLELSRGVSKILEIGPGTGYVTSILMDKFPDAEITCMDISSTMLKQLSRRTRARTLYRRPRLLQGDVTKPVPIDGDTFDLVIIQGVIEHLRLVAPALHELFRLLRPGGVLLMGDIADNFWGRLFAVVFRVRSFTSDEVNKLLRDIGFEETRFLDYMAAFPLKGALFFVTAAKPAKSSPY